MSKKFESDQAFADSNFVEALTLYEGLMNDMNPKKNTAHWRDVAEGIVRCAIKVKDGPKAKMWAQKLVRKQYQGQLVEDSFELFLFLNFE